MAWHGMNELNERIERINCSNNLSEREDETRKNFQRNGKVCMKN